MKNTAAEMMMFLGPINKRLVAAEQEFYKAELSLHWSQDFPMCPPCTTHGILNMIGFLPVISYTVSHVHI